MRALAGDGGDGTSGGLLESAVALRWSRPDLTGAIADHVLDISGSDADPTRWLQAAGWAVSARSATGDGRTVAADVLEGVARRGVHVLDEPAADRLRVELALLATGAGRLGAARALLTPVSVADTGPELRADALAALARCAVEDRPAAVDGLLRRVEATWAEVGGPRGHIGTAAASLVAATAERRAGRPGSAVDKAVEGLAHLDRARGDRSQSPSRHLAAGLAAEWISGLLDVGRAAEARDGCVPLEPRLRDTSRPSRQIALLRFAVARTVAGSGTEAVVASLVQAARDAAASDAPDLESLCLSSLGALQEKSGQLEQGVESVRVGVEAQRRDQRRAERFRNAFDVAVSADPAERASRWMSGDAGGRRSEQSAAGAGPSASRTAGTWTDRSSAVAGDRPPVPPPSAGTANGSDRSWTGDRAAQPAAGSNGHRSAGNGAAGRAADGAATDPHGFSPWRGWTDDSPIGHLLARSLQPEATDAGHTVPPPPPPPEGTGDRPGVSPTSRREERAYPPDAAAPDPWAPDPWATGAWSTGARSTGAWSTGNGARNDELAGRRATTWSDGAPAPSPTPAARGGRRRRADPEDGATAAPAAVTQDRGAVESDPLTGPLPAADRPSTWYDQYDRGTRLPAADRSVPEWGAAPAERVTEEREGAFERAADIAVDPASGSWLQNALAELDRAWGTLPAGPSAGTRPPEPETDTDTETDGCVVVIDLARDGRRFAGRRAGAVVRALADRLTGPVPSGGRVRHDDGDALSVVLPGWKRSQATEWMHRTLPGLFEDFVTDEDMPGTQLRAAVHDADGPVGAQLLQRLDSPRRRHATTEAASAGPQWGGLPAGPGGSDARPAGGGRRHRRSADEQPATAATGQDVVRGAPPAAVGTERPDPIDGLGLADLLAGALAAYRGI